MITGLTALMLWLSGVYSSYGVPASGVALDSDGGESLHSGGYAGLREGGWDEIVRKVKDVMSNCGLRELRRQVAIVCGKGITEDRA
ncbi:hypothetical protein [Pyrolobus fumarii]|uniref:hypothetical protein n=1 Tax=Pyrolobus fumarii TaxID=54252 RepID=UPI00068D7D32|nr:hypothetical protein [Pyrolobus fumarii]